jgi:hypothetical protein
MMRSSLRVIRLSLLALALGVAAAPSGTAHAADNGWSHHHPYQGEWAGGTAFREIRATVERERIAALGTISRSLGLELRGDKRIDGIAFEYLDEGTAGPLGFPATSRGGFRPPADPTVPERVITVIVDKFLQSRDELPSFVCHEMIHATMSLLMGDQFTELAPWVQEGLAVYGSGQGPDKLARLAATEGAEPKGFPDGLDSQEDRLADYVEAYLAIAYLAETRGPQSVRLFTGEVVRGVAVEQAIANASHATWPQFRNGAADYARERLAAVAPKKVHGELVIPEAEPVP